MSGINKWMRIFMFAVIDEINHQLVNKLKGEA